LWVTGEYYDGFRAAELASRGRLAAPAQPDPNLRLDWFKRTADYALPGTRPLILRARAGQTEVWLFLARTRPNRAFALSGSHTSRFGPVYAGEPDDQLKRALLSAAARRLRLFGLSRLTLEPMLPDVATQVSHAFRRGGWSVSERSGPANFLLDVAGRHFEEYWEGCSPRLHEQVAAGSRQLNVEVADLITPRLQEEIELVGGADPFLRDLAQDATLDRNLRLGIARVGEVPVAAQIWTIEDGAAFCHWRAEDREARHLFPGPHLTAAVLRYLINVDHAPTIDFGTGAEAELADWADERRVLRRLDLFNPRAPSAWAPALGARVAGLVRRPPLD
jgi:CelD/BcsL family acetyltransferase involved in cellulose biosynthesis